MADPIEPNLAAARLERLIELQRRIRGVVVEQMAAQSIERLSRSVRDDEGDTIFAIDVAAEDVLLPFCREWGREECFLLIAEGLDPAGEVFGGSGREGFAFRLIVDPIDGTRGLMFDKRSAWCLAATAPDQGPSTPLSAVDVAVMTELPTTRQSQSDRLTAIAGQRAQGVREDLVRGTSKELALVPSQHTDLLHGFASVANFFQGGKALTGQLEERLFELERDGWNPDKAEIYTDQYICSGGQMAEVILGRDRFVLDPRPLVHRKLGIDSSLCSRPYDVCTKLVAEAAGCVVRRADGSPLDPPLDLTTNVDFVAYANPALAQRMQPLLDQALRELGLTSTAPADDS